MNKFSFKSHVFVFKQNKTNEEEKNHFQKASAACKQKTKSNLSSL